MGKNIEIEEYPDIPQEIIEAINSEKLVVFIGAGVSRLLGCKSWWDLAKKLIDKCYEKKDDKGNSIINYRERELLLQTNDSKKLITIAKNILEEEIFYQEMEKTLEPENNKIEENIYDLILELRGICITTNADKILHKYYIEDKRKYENLDFDIENISTKNLYQIHGRIDRRESLIFTVDQYVSRYSVAKKENEKFLSFLKDVFSKYIVLFIGYGVSEFELLDYVIAKGNISGKPRHFILNPYYSEEKKILECDELYFKKLNINVIPFSKDKLGYNQLIEVLKRWREIVKLKAVKTVKSLTGINEILEDRNFNKIQDLEKDFLNSDYRKKFFLSLLKKEGISLKLINFILKNFSLKGIELEKIFEKDSWLELEVLEKLIVRNEERDFIDSEIKDIVLNNTINIEKYILKNEIKNFTLNKRILSIILILKEKISKEDRNLFSKEMKQKQGWSILFINMEKYIFPYLIKNHKKQKLETIFIILLEYNINHYMENHYNDFDPIYSSLFKNYSKYIFTICSSVTITEHLYKLINETFLKNKSIFDKIFIPYIDEKYLDDAIGAELLVKLLYQNLKVVDLKQEKYTKILLDMLNSKIEIFIRIAVKIIDENIELKDLLFYNKLIINLFENMDMELANFLENHCQKFTNEELNTIIEGIESSFSKYNKNQQALYKKSWFNKLKKINTLKVENLYNKYNMINLNENLDFKNEDIYESFEEIKNISPITEEEIIKYIKDGSICVLKNELFKYENQKNDFWGKKPSKKGLMETLKEVSLKNTKLIINNLKELNDIEEEYLYYIFEGICKNDKISLYEIELIVEFIEEKIRDNKIWNIVEENSALELKRKLSDVLYFIFQKENLSQEILIRIFKILKFCLKQLPIEEIETDDIVDFGLNSYKGNYLDLLFRLSLRLKEMESKYYNEVFAFTKEYLMNNKFHNIASYIIGYRIKSLIYLDKNWIKENKKVFFSKDQIDYFWNTMGAYLIINSQLNLNLYDFMKKEYEIAVELFEYGNLKYKNRLIEHMILGYFYYNDNNIFKLIDKKEEFILEKILRFSIYYSGKFHQTKVIKIWRKILIASFDQECEGKIYTLSIGLIAKCNSLNSNPLKNVINNISNNDKIYLNKEVYLGWINKYLKNKNNDNLKRVTNIIRKFTKQGKLFEGYLNINLIEKLLLELYKNNLKEEADNICNDYIKRNNLVFNEVYLKYNENI